MRIAAIKNKLYYLARLLRTISYLRPSQFYYRIRKNFLFLFSRHLAEHAASLAKNQKLDIRPVINSIHSIKTNHSYKGQKTFEFLNQEYTVSTDWKADQASHLWKFNLHYFDFLFSTSAHDNEINLINDWILNVKVGDKIAWHPYPLSKRICNWVWFLSEKQLTDEKILLSLKQQYIYLAYFLEKDLLGNHLITNITALIVAGSFFKDDSTIKSTLQLLEQELNQQILADGGHYERSPMYHSLVLEDLVAIYDALIDKYPVPDFLISAIHKCSEFYANIIDNNSLPLLNDSSSEIALEPAKFLNYLLEHQFISQNYLNTLPDFRVLKDSGLIAYRTEELSLTFDAGNIGPDFLPGHAHNDTLSMLININQEEFLTDSGIYHYQGELRNYFRSSRAHNVVMLKDTELNETWSAFRVGRRGYITKFYTDTQNKSAYAEHSCYSYLGIQIAREIRISQNTILWTDIIRTNKLQKIESNLHFAPGISCEQLEQEFVFFREGKKIAHLKIPDGMQTEILSSVYSKEFGKKMERLNLRFTFSVSGNSRLAFELVNH